MNIHISEHPTNLIAACADYVLTTLSQSIADRGIARIALAGGSTPIALYDFLATSAEATQLDWNCVTCYFGDERAVPQTHPDSNYLMADQHLFQPLNIPASHCFPMISKPMGDLSREADRYNTLLDRWAGPKGPVFDLILNGMGEDGHFASLFPQTPALDERQRWVAVNPVPQLSTERLTLTFPVFEQARAVCFLAAGDRKRAAFHAIQQPDSTLPSARLVQRRETAWFVDQACAGRAA